MPEALAQTLALPGLGWIVVVTVAAGIVYGFAGFGSALIFMPAAAAVIPLQVAVAAFAVTALSSLVTVVPGAFREADRSGLWVLIPTAALGAWIGLWVLQTADLLWLRWAVVGVTALTLLALVSGWRMRTEPTRAAHAGIGLGTGFLGGAVGLLGPVMVLFQLAGRGGAARTRATTLVFLSATSTLILPLMALRGMLTVPALLTGAVLMLPYAIGSRIGAMLFQPQREGLYRGVAYVIIACAIAVGLPIRD